MIPLIPHSEFFFWPSRLYPWLDWLYRRLPYFARTATAYKPGLARIRQLLTALGNPHRHFPAVHIAGTNGKGFVAHTLAAVLHRCGLTVGLLTSPHLLTVRERIRVAFQMAPPEFFEEVFPTVQRIARQTDASYFEVLTALAFLYFAELRVDVAVVEVGMGGRLDATNVLQQPLLTAITSIHYDHQAFLGKTLRQIAREKAGIIKRGVPVVLPPPSAMHWQPRTVITRIAHQRTAPLIVAKPLHGQICFPVSRHWGLFRLTVHRNDNAGQTEVWHVEAPPHTGTLSNLAIVQSMLAYLAKRLSISMPDAAWHASLRNLWCSGYWGRWQFLPWRGYRFLLDGAHNPQAWQRLIESLRPLLPKVRTCHVLLGISRDKSLPSNLLEELRRWKARIYPVEARVPRRLPAKQLAQRLKARNWQPEPTPPTVDQAIPHVLAQATEQDLIVVTGSLFLVGDALTWFLLQEGDSKMPPTLRVKPTKPPDQPSY